MSGAHIAWIRKVLQQHVKTTGQDLEVSVPVPFETQGFESYCPLFKVEVRGDSGTVPLIAKILPPDGLIVYLSSRLQQRNENVFYGEFLPFLIDTAVEGRKGMEDIKAIGSLFPKLFCYYENDDQSLLAIENITPSGFVLAPKILDLDHLKLCLRELGRIHALSYIAKKKNQKAFFDIVKHFNPWEEARVRQHYTVIHGLTQFAFDEFRKEFPEDGEKYADNLKKIDSIVDRFFNYLEPEEPLAVLCHGDYNRNNIMFKYDSDGRPSSLKVIDFQLVTYSSPAIDVGLLLFMSTSPEVRDSNWDDLWDEYRTPMLDTMEKSLNCSRAELEKEFSKEVLLRDFDKYSIHAFLVAAFFLPATMMGQEESEKLKIEGPFEEFEKHIAGVKRLCSEEVKKRLAVLVKLMLNRNVI